jgi:glutamine amidotransferase
MKTALIDYGSGNLASAAKALMRAANGTEAQIVTTADPEIVRSAERIVLSPIACAALPPCPA